jgi:TolB-like protein/Flp pilus assembly protein TadD
MPEDRRLAAIMFTDIVGYSKLMGEDEDKAFEILKINREIHTLQLSKYDGTFIKEMGDGILASFFSPLKAVQCAIAIQEESKSENIPLRIGIHEADVIFERGDILGDGVNVASRLEEMADTGCIYISGAVYKDIKNKVGISTEFIEEKTLKNVKEPVRVYKISCKEIYNNIVEEKSFAPPIKPSIAVLPFVNMSADPEQEYFCDGITEEIINALSHVEGLKIIARTSAFMFKDKHEDIREIGKKLDVETLLEGSVRKAGHRIRITAQLIKVSDGSHLWSERYDRDLKDIFAIQDEISLAIVSNLKVKLLRKEKEAIVKRYTEDLDAYNLYLKGTYYCQMFTPEGFEKAIKHFEKALKNDPQFGLAYLGPAMVFWSSSYWGNVPPMDAYPKAKEYVKKALEIDDKLAEAHLMQGSINMNYDWDWKAAEKELKLSLQLNPNNAHTHLYYSWYLTFMGNHEKAISEAKQARKLDPLSSYSNTHVGITYSYCGQFDKAIEELQMTLTMNPYYFLARFHLGAAYVLKKMFNEAIEEYIKAADLSEGNPMIVSALASLYYFLGRKEKAEKLTNNLKNRLKQQYVPATCFYLFYISQGKKNQAFDWLEKAINERDSFLPWFIIHPNKRLQIPDEPRFNELLEKVGLKIRRN